jgi:hypothetical protein
MLAVAHGCSRRGARISRPRLAAELRRIDRYHEGMQMEENVATARAWQEAANSQDLAQLLARSAPDITLIGPRGAVQGHEALRAWLGRAGLTLTTRRLYARGDSVVAAQRGVWRDLATGELAGEADVATWFRVAGGQVTFLARYDQLAEALAAAGLTAADAWDGEA